VDFIVDFIVDFPAALAIIQRLRASESGRENLRRN
jgi:hypothetical protein